MGVLPRAGCPGAGSIRVVSDSDQRTIATGDQWLSAALPGCAVANEHPPQGADDPTFSPISAGLVGLDPRRADAAVTDAAGPGGIPALEATYRPLLDRLDRILCGRALTPCGVSGKASGVTRAAAGKEPKLTGALGLASGAAQTLLLEYADGKPPTQVGWGRASAQDIAALSALHSLKFALLARPPYLAGANLAGLLPVISAGLTGTSRVTLISGHDTNVASLGGLLGVHWQVPGLAPDDPVPGGALILEQLRDRDGVAYVRVIYRSQTLAQVRGGGAEAPGYRMVLPVPGCDARGVAGLCTLAEMRGKLSPAV